MLTIDSTVPLRQGASDSPRIPLLGLGTYRSPRGAATHNAVRRALELGYRHVDTAKAYGNEADVGAAIRESGVAREDVFVTTKLWNEDHGFERTLGALDGSLRRLGMDYVDLYLVHWPVEGLRLESWRALEALLTEGKARAIGVSNYMVRHLDELFGHAAIVPAVNQIELSPFNLESRRDVVDLCRERGIVIEAYSPLTKGRKLDDPGLARIAEKHARTPAQVLIRWSLQHGFVVLPKSVTPDRIAENAAVYDFVLDDEDMAALDARDEALATGWDPTDAP
ncbi:MAG TPA: aldo/keto reductase [Longimicrobiales bacterium]|nr:aldo/keto reductase [Longimicrobiales bacterium]